jgi:hypothetical protein
MREFAGILLLFALVTMAIKAAVMLLILAGLIFRTSQTLGLIALCAILTGFCTYPLAATAITATLIALSLWLKRREANASR